MKKIYLPLLLASTLSMFFGCSKPAEKSVAQSGSDSTPAKTEDTTPAKSEKKVKELKDIVIGVSLPTQREERWVRDKGTFEKYAKELGVKAVVQISDADMAIQSQQFRSLISQGVDVIILAPHDSGASGTLVDEAEAEGIPVVAYGRNVLNTKNLDGYATIDIRGFGAEQGKYLAKLAPSGNYIVLKGAATDSATKDYYEGAMEYIQPLVDSGAVKVISDQFVENWLPDNARKLVENALTTANNDVQAILAPNDGTAGGAIAALKAAGVSGNIPITGQDAEFSALQRIKDGVQTMDVYADTVQQAKNAVDMAILLAQGKDVTTIAKNVTNNGAVDVPSMFLPPQVIDKDNLPEQAKKLFDDGLLTEDQYKQLTE